MENAKNSVSLRKNQKDRKNIKLIILKRSNLKKKRINMYSRELRRKTRISEWDYFLEGRLLWNIT